MSCNTYFETVLDIAKQFIGCDVFFDANFCTFKLFNLGEAKNEEVCRNEENDQFERSKIVSIFLFVS